MTTLLAFFLFTQPVPPRGEPANTVRYGHAGQSQLQKRKGLLRPDGHLFARDESSPFIQQVLKPSL